MANEARRTAFHKEWSFLLSTPPSAHRQADIAWYASRPLSVEGRREKEEPASDRGMRERVSYGPDVYDEGDEVDGVDLGELFDNED
jgi:hypothetical protein